MTLPTVDCFRQMDIIDQLASIYGAILDLAIDPDAQAYFERAGVADLTAKHQINAFIVGAKAGGYWESMDDAWLLRSTQNSGSGVTAYALKSDANNGTLVNAPTWGSDGIVFSLSSSQKITTAFSPSGGEVTAFGTHNPTDGANSLAVASQDDIANRRWELVYEGSVDVINWFVFNPAFTQVGISSTEAVFRSVIGRCGAAVNKIHDFVSAEASAAVGSVANAATPLWIGARQNGAGDFFYNGTIAHVLYFSAVLSDVQKAHLYANIKATIGSGLSLP